MARPGDWLEDGAHAGRDRMTDATVRPPLERIWLYNATAGFGPGSPLIYQNTVLVGNRRGELHAVDLESGKKVGYRNLGESLEGPLVIHDGILYVANAWGKYALIAYDLLSGEKVWRLKGTPIEVAPTIIDGRLVTVDVNGVITARELEDGAEIWSSAPENKTSVAASPLLPGGNRLFVVTDSGSAEMIDPRTGEDIWRRELGEPVYVSPSCAENTLFIPTTRGGLIALDAGDGSTKWTFDLPDKSVRIGPVSTDGDTAYFGTSSGKLVAVNAHEGHELWRFEAPDAITAPVLLTPEYLYVGTMGRMLYAIERDSGTVVWEAELKGRIKSAMAARDGNLILMTEPRYVYLFRTEGEDASRP